MSATAPNPPKTRILIAEDSPTQAELLRRRLADAQYDVLVARDGGEALRLSEEQDPQFVISDVSKPHMDGFELCQQLCRSEIMADKPIILLTALTDIWDVIHGLNAGADNYVTKYFDPQLLLERVAES